MAEVKSIVEGLKSYFDECPIIKEMGTKIKVDFLKDESRTFSIEPIPGTQILEEYLEKYSLRQYRFNLVAKFRYSDESMMNIQNSQFFERLGEWIEVESENGNLPKLPKGNNSEEINIATNGYLFSVTPDWKTARYQLQLQLVYMHQSK